MTDDVKINDYIFYKITCLDASKNLLYIGHTTNMKNQESKHKHECKNKNHKKYYTKIYRIIRENGGWKNFHMNAFDKKASITRKEAKNLEREFVIDLKANMNIDYPLKWYTKITCRCGCIIKNYELKLHQESNEHINKMKIINESITDRTLDLYTESLFENNTNDSNVVGVIIPDIKNIILD